MTDQRIIQDLSNLQQESVRRGEPVEMSNIWESLGVETQIALARQWKDNLPKGNLERTMFLAFLGVSILEQFQQIGGDERLIEGISYLREALSFRPTPHPHRSTSLYDLGTAVLMRFNASGAREYLEEGIALHREALSLRPRPHLERSMSVSSLGRALEIRFELSGAPEDLSEAILFYREALSHFPKTNPDRLSSIFTLGGAILTRYEKTKLPEDLNEAITLHREALILCSPSHPHRFRLLSDLANLLASSSERSEALQELNEAILYHREALSLRPPPADQLMSLYNLSNALHERFERSGDLEDLDEAIIICREALSLEPAPRLEHSKLFSKLGNLLRSRYHRSGSRKDLDEAIRLHREALSLRVHPHPERPTMLNYLSNTLLLRYEQSGSREDLEKSIILQREGLSLCRSPHPMRSTSLNNLANAMLALFKQTGDNKDLNEVVSLNREALFLRPAPDPNRSTSLLNLANAIYSQFQRSGEHKDLDEVIVLQRESLFLCSRPDRSMPLCNLATSLSTRFEQSGRHEDMHEAIILHQEALSLRPPSHPNRSLSLFGLANAILERFKQLGEHDDLDEAISFHREALSLRPQSHPDRSMSLNNLAISLLIRLEESGAPDDLDEVIILHREALELHSALHPNRPMTLNNLSNALLTRYQLWGRCNDLDEAILFQREAFVLRSPLHPNYSMSLSNLANALTLRFAQLENLNDLDESIRLSRSVLFLCPPPHPNRLLALTHLGNNLLIRFKLLGRRVELDESILRLREAVDMASSIGHPLLCKCSMGLGQSLTTLFSLSRETGWLTDGMDAFRVAANSASSALSTRLKAAVMWAGEAQLNNHSSTMEAYELAISLLPLLSSLGHNLRRRQEGLTGTDGLARRAAIYAISLGKYDRAVEFLDAGRTVFWLQALRLRTPMDELRDATPELADTLSHISSELERGSHLELRTEGQTNETKQAVEKEISYFRSLSDRWVKALEEARRLKGFEDFLQPSKLSTLQRAAQSGPVVILVADHSQSHAIIMTTDDIQHIDLPYVNALSARKLISQMHDTTPKGRRTATVDVDSLIGKLASTDLASVILEGPIKLSDLHPMESVQTRMGRPFNASEHEVFQTVLKVLWEGIVHPIIQALDLQKYQDLPIVRWCPTGLFSFLPIHAAGIYTPDMTSVDSAVEYLVSTYIPTIGALQLSKPGCYDANFKMLVVIDSKTLPSTVEESRKIEKYVSREVLVKLGLPDGMPASIDRVLSHLSSSSIVHFACHGTQSNYTPLESALVLDDGHLKISRVMQERMLNAELAFLCACETAMGDENLPDEAMHLGATLLFSGFRAVIATMWSIEDSDGPVIADSFYEYLFRESSSTLPKINQAARALHAATAKLRSQHASFKQWVPFIHLGI